MIGEVFETVLATVAGVFATLLGGIDGLGGTLFESSSNLFKK